MTEENAREFSGGDPVQDAFNQWAERGAALADMPPAPGPVERCWVQMSLEEKVETLRNVLAALSKNFDEHQHSASGWVVVTPESLTNTLS